VEGKGRDTQTCNIVWNMQRDQSFWITSSEHQGMMPKGIFSFSCSMQVIQFADLQFHLSKQPDVTKEIKEFMTLISQNFVYEKSMLIQFYV
jgi:hypothetical protein